MSNTDLFLTFPKNIKFNALFIVKARNKFPDELQNFFIFEITRIFVVHLGLITFDILHKDAITY